MENGHNVALKVKNIKISRVKSSAYDLLKFGWVNSTQVLVSKELAPVVRKVDNAIHRINHYPLDSVVCFC